MRARYRLIAAVGSLLDLAPFSYAAAEAWIRPVPSQPAWVALDAYVLAADSPIHR
jgi:hypothetical protein